MPDYSYLSTIGTPFHPAQSHPECLWWASRSSIIWLPSTFLGLFSALLNGPCALASLGYLLLPVWGWLYWYYVCNSLQCVFYVSTGVSEDFLQLYRPLLQAAMHSLAIIQPLESFSRELSDDRHPGYPPSCAPTDSILIHTEALPWEVS